ncbi:MAG: hypothetical protein G01um101413_531 [Parcubacteria group bacterium Gr01-1014_13]|nr:MAG: hypothetical protein G01um101413_531 [Parcubacteria group bacterium Gr01-1014_13]
MMLLQIITSVLKRKKYGLIALGAGIIMAGLSYYLTIVNVAFHSFSILLQMDGPLFTTVSFALSLAISALFGIYLGLIFFRHDLMKGNKNAKAMASGLGGTIAGVVASACPTCGAPLLALFGAPLGLMALPFQGLEIKVVSILLLLLSVYLLAQSIEKKLNC